MIADEGLLARAEALLARCREAGVMIATAESCTGGLVAGLLTAIAGSSAVVERGFVTYSNEAKSEMLGVPAELIAGHGAVSREVAEAMAEGALAHSRASLTISITGIAGPGGGSAAKPVGLVFLGRAAKGQPTHVIERRYGDLGRDGIRRAALEDALSLLEEAVA